MREVSRIIGTCEDFINIIRNKKEHESYEYIDLRDPYEQLELPKPDSPCVIVKRVEA